MKGCPLIFSAVSFLAFLGLGLKAAEPAEMAAAREAYGKSMKRASLPIYANYLKQLQSLKLTFTRSGKLDAAIAVDNEIKEVTKLLEAAQASVAAAAPATPGGAAPAPGVAADPTEEVVGKWTFRSGARAPVWRELKADGTVLKEGGGTGRWAIQGNTLSIRYGDGASEFALPVRNGRMQGKGSDGNAILAEKN